MDNILEKEKILLKNKCHILRMPNSKKKVEMLHAYFSLLEYYRFVTGEEDVSDVIDIDDEFTKKYERYIINDTKKKIDEVESNAKILYEKYQKILDTYKENDFCKYEYIKLIKVNKPKMEEALWDFFSFLGDDVLKIFYEMLSEDNIHFNNNAMERLGYAMDSTPIDNACITVQNIPYYLDFYITLAHEVGHCYQFYLQKNQKNCAMFDPYCEITSILFEKLFIEYLMKNHIIKDDLSLSLEDNISFLNTVSISKIICKLLIDNKIGMINPYNLSYTCLIQEDEIKKTIIDDCGYVKPFLMKPEFVEIHYSFGNIIARNFVKKMDNDFDVEWQNFKNFICTVNYLPMNEVLDKYFDVDLIQNDIKKLTKSYRGR